MTRKETPETHREGELLPHLKELFESALAAHQAGRLTQAESLYNRLLDEQPDQPDTLNLLGVVALQTGRTDIAIACVGRALENRPRVPDYHYNLGLAYSNQGRRADAAKCFLTATELKPDYAEAHNNLANALMEEGNSEESSKHYRIALDINPDHPGAHNNLGSLLKDAGELDEAVVHFQEAIRIEPTFARAHYNLGLVLCELRRYARAAESFRATVSIEPGFAEAHFMLGNALRNVDRYVSAAQSIRRALAIKPDMFSAHADLGTALKEQGLLDESLASTRRSLAIRSHPVAHSGLIVAMSCHPDFGASEIHAEARRWNDRFARPLAPESPTHNNDRSPDRRLKIGYLSRNFRRHPVGYFQSSVFTEHDKDQFEVICYSGVRSRDDLTELFVTHADQWREVGETDDETLAQLMRTDGVDIAVELSGHFGGNRLLALARKPSPIQIFGGGHCTTSGVDGMDYLISDRFHTPEGSDQYYSEKLLRLPDGYVCYAPPDYAPPVAQSPARDRGYITFGCYNNLSKVTTQVVQLWAAVLNAVPDSRFRLQTLALNESVTRDRLRAQFESLGVKGSRIALEPRVPHAELLANYSKIDVALDPFPYSGGLTTCEALWMGVPVITLTGTTFAGRHSTSHLSNIGLTELITDSREAYLALATDLARDLHRLEAIRGSLRERMGASPLCDAKRYTRNLESAYRELWREWCRTS